MRRHAIGLPAGSTARADQPGRRRNGSPSGRLPLGLVCALAVAAVVLCLPALAGAATRSYVPGSPPSICNGIGSGAGQCDEIKSVAVDQSTGHLFVLEAASASGNYRVSEFTQSGAFVKAFANGVATGASTPQVCTTTCLPGNKTGLGSIGNGAKGIAVDSETHIVYLVSGAAKVAYYDGVTGSFLGEFNGTTIGTQEGQLAPATFASTTGIGVDASNPLQHYLYVVTGFGASSAINKFKVPVASGGTVTALPAYVCQVTGRETASATECHGTASKDGIYNGLSFPSPPKSGLLAVDDSGNLFAAEDSTRNVVSMFDSTGAFVKAFSAPTPIAVATGITGRILVAGGGTSNGALKVQEFDVSSGAASGLEFGEGTLVGSLGLAVSTIGPATGRHVFVADQNGRQIWHYRLLTEPVPVPGCEMKPVTGVTATGATLNGKVTVPIQEGEGVETTYRFEVSSDSVHWTSYPATDASVGYAPGPVNVSQEAKPLQPNTGYQVRLRCATSPTSVAEPKPETTFNTLQAPPTVTQESTVIGVTATTGKISGTVNPNNSNTHYRFEYGTTAAYGRQSPAEFEPFLGSSGQPIAVAASLGGLKPSTTYHWRIVAINGAGETAGADQQFTTYKEEEALNSSGLPNNRAFELVTPADKRPVGLVTPFFNTQLALQVGGNGEALGYPVLNGLDDSLAGGETRYRASRSAAGWKRSEVSAPSLVNPSREGNGASIPGRVHYYSPEDLKCAIVESINPLSADVPAADIAYGVSNLYRWNAADGSYTLITDKVPLNPDAEGGPTGYYNVVGASRDCTRILFRSRTYSFIPGATGYYEWDEGTWRDALRLPNGSLAVPPSVGLVDQDFSTYRNTVSPSGRMFFFATSNEPAVSGVTPGDFGKRAVFVRKSPTETVDASLPTHGPTSGATYEMASPDGSHVFFLANYGIAATSSSGPNGDCSSRFGGSNGEFATTPCDLYDYNVETGELRDISADPNPGDPTGAVVQGVLDVSKDGSVVYFAALGQLVPGKGRTYAQNLEGAKYANVYRYKSGVITYVGSISSANMRVAGVNGALAHNPKSWNAQTTDSGNYLLFVSSDNVTGTNPAEVEQAYLYSALTGATTCVSCPPDGSAPHAAGDGVIADRESYFWAYTPSSLSEDGRVVFAVEDALTPGAVEGHGAGAGDNGQLENNIYEWHEGQLSLLATGQVDVVGMGGPNGRDVFIRTTEQLTADDFDFVFDVYDLRAGGGFPQPAPPPVPCDPAADQCQGTPLPVPGVPTPSTERSGPGNPPAVPANPKHGKKKHKKGKKHKNKQKKRQGQGQKKHQARTANNDRGGKQ